MSTSQTSSQEPHLHFTPLIWLSLAFISGIVLASTFKINPLYWVILCVLSLVVLVTSVISHRLTLDLSSTAHLRQPNTPHILYTTLKKFNTIGYGIKFPLPLALLITAISLGALRYQKSQPIYSPAYLHYYNDSKPIYIVEGIINKPPEFRESNTELVIQVDRIRPTYDLQFISVSGMLLARISLEGDWYYGDRVRIKGYIQTPTETDDFSYRDYLARWGIYSYMEASQINLLGRKMGSPLLYAIYGLRERAHGVIYELFPDPEASLLAGILLGIDSDIPKPVMDAFNATGTSHVIAISGFNIAILSALLATLFGRVMNRWKALAATIVGITIYTILVGADSAVVRAGIMGGLSLLAIQLGRRQEGLNSLAITAAIMALANPRIIGDLSFLLSFAATFGLVLYAEPLSNIFKQKAARWIPQASMDRVAGYVGEYILFTIAAQVVTIPIIAYYFERISLISFIVNPIILPAQPLLMILGGLATIFGLIYLPLGKILAALALPFALYTIRMVEFFNHIPNRETLLGDIPLIMVLLFYAALMLVTFSGEKIKDYISKVKPGFPLAVLSIITILVWQIVLVQPDSRLHLTLLNISGQGKSGNGIFIHTPTGRYILINGGPSASLLSDALGRRMPLTNHTLDWLVIAVPSSDDIAALPRIVDRNPPANVLWAGATHGNSISRNLWNKLIESQTPVTLAETGHTLELGAGALLKTLSVSSRGSVLLLEWQNFRALIPLGLDVGYMEQSDYGRDIGPINVLLLAENGYIPVNPPEWIMNLNPQLVLLSVAADDTSGLPSSETISNLAGYDLLRTDRDGWIHIITDGQYLWVESEK